jgi:hypothetical protein
MSATAATGTYRRWFTATERRLRSGPPLFLGYLFLQWLAVAGLTTPRYPDSETYMHFSLTGADTRLPTVPLFYKLVPASSGIFGQDTVRVAVQALVAAAAWWTLAQVSGRMIGDRRVRLGLQGVLLLLGLVGPIVAWNSIVLSESLAISLTVLMIAAWLRYVLDPRWTSAAAAVAATLFWTFTRQPNVLFGLMITAIAVIAAIVGKDRRRLQATVAVALIVVSALGLFEIHRNRDLSRASINYMLEYRLPAKPAYIKWFLRHGMPLPNFDRAQAQGGRAIPTNPAFTRWLDTKGERTYLEFVATHPRYTVLDPLPFFSGEPTSLHQPNFALFPALQPNPTPSMLSPTANYGRHREVLPSLVEQLLFDQGQIGALILLAAAGIGLTWLGWKRFGPDRRLLVPALVAASAIPQGYIVWLSGGEATHELDRLSMVTAVSVRVGLWLLLAIALDRLATARSTSGSEARMSRWTSRGHLPIDQDDLASAG